MRQKAAGRVDESAGTQRMAPPALTRPSTASPLPLISTPTLYPPYPSRSAGWQHSRVSNQQEKRSRGGRAITLSGRPCLPIASSACCH